MKLWQVAVLAYAAIYFLLAGTMEAGNVSQGYPVAYVAFSMIAQTMVVGGVVLFGLEKGPEFATVWRWLFPLLVLELVVGIVLDATYQSDPDDLLMNELVGLWLAAPAYYFNFRIARYRG
jgi:Ni,Fe-hydrogenase I cytochrome b subunit